MTSLCDLSAVELRRLIGTKEISPVELLDDCLGRIEAVNPAINAVVALDIDGAQAAAREAERQALRGEDLGPLHGLPVGIKDLSETKGLKTTWGSLIYKDHVPTRDETTVAAVKAAGGIVFAKTNTPEFGAGANTRNGVYGATGNPFAPELTSAGSSGGSAAALAAGMMPLATGSDMGGSLRTPAAFCGVVGFRPTPGLVPSDRRLLGYSPLSVDGPMGRTVADAALLLSAIAREDAIDPLSGPVDPKAFFPLPEVDLARLKIAVSEDLGFAPVDDDVRAIFHERCGLFADLFQSSVERDPELGDAHRTFAILRAESFEAGQRALAERHRDLLQLPVRANLEQAEGFTLADHAKAQAEQTRLYRRFQALFDEVDLLICPTAAVSPFPHAEWHPTEINGAPLAHYFQWIALTYGLTLTGHPVVALPCGVDHKGLPFGIQICGKRRGDAQVLAAALALERVFQTRPKLARPVPDLAALEGSR
ncbi:amidase [Aliidongia dinghuensis]|uniref:Amidase n=1 Tax=Aliidongia dinghuensis TaxID=1867774 RepID=A0A8J2YP63_9PROT|nr:amidase family protein [Aliidongia dinghuensis]GGE99880.1 amidase [Aliidongia dinghuensis]